MVMLETDSYQKFIKSPLYSNFLGNLFNIYISKISKLTICLFYFI